MKYITIITLMIATVFLSCNESKNITDNNNNSSERTAKEAEASINKASQQKDLIGEWQWTKTDCCGRMNKTTFASEDEPKKIISFQKGGKVRYYTRGDQGKMSMQDYSMSMMGTQATVKIGEYQAAIYTVKADELVLSWGYMDLQSETYKRVSYKK